MDLEELRRIEPINKRKMEKPLILQKERRKKESQELLQAIKKQDNKEQLEASTPPKPVTQLWSPLDEGLGLGWASLSLRVRYSVSLSTTLNFLNKNIMEFFVLHEQLDRTLC